MPAAGVLFFSAQRPKCCKDNEAINEANVFLLPVLWKQSTTFQALFYYLSSQKDTDTGSFFIAKMKLLNTQSDYIKLGFEADGSLKILKSDIIHIKYQKQPKTTRQLNNNN